ncbi:MAG: DNA gyrase subunit A, partial [Candidatus Competibacterales bacterium]|nr:DNA gyrase subunit A [Candidatus Competibacterales bacterium]
VGDVIGKYHPHGDAAVYDTIVRLAQPFSMRYPLVDGQGNFGSIDGDAPAAMRYTEVRMARITQQLLADIDKDTVDFVPNYDASEQEPAVFPTRIPNLLVSGASGIAVGMATNIPPHNLGEVCAAAIALIDDPDLGVDDLLTHLPGPDFPTAAIINGAAGIHEAYRSGRGRIYLRARSHVEILDSGREAIIVTELPYQVNKARLLEKIAELVKERRLEGISELRDESDKDGLRIHIELRRGEVPEVVLNNLYQHTPLQSVFGINMVALVDGQPRLLNLKSMLEAFLRHRREVVTRRTLFELGKARDRAHILEGLAVALANIDPIIALIRRSPGPAEAKAALLARAWTPGIVTAMLERAGPELTRPEHSAPEQGLQQDGYRLSPTQAQAILDLRLHRLTGLEQDKVHGEYGELLDRINDLLDILTRPDRLMQVIRDELIRLVEQFGDARRSEILTDQLDLSLEDLITEEDMVVTLSHTGYAKSQPLTSYRAQRRGGRGKSATDIKDEDFIDKLWVANSHDILLCFSDRGKVYWLKVYELPQAGRNARGKPIVNLLPLEKDERITAVLPVREFDTDHFVFFATRRGTVKKTPLTDYSRPRASGIIALDLAEDDQLVGVAITNGARDIMLFNDTGKAIRFHESDVRPMGRNARGVRGMRLARDGRVIALIVVDRGAILTVTKNGYGKRTAIDDYPVYGRGGQGVISIQTSERNGRVIGAVQVDDDHELMLITNGGTLVRTRVAEISLLGRNTQGVKLISLHGEENLIGLARIEVDDDEDPMPATEAGD